MKIASRMNLDDLAKLVGVDRDAAKTVRTRLVLIADGKDTDDISVGTWQKIIPNPERESNPSVQVDTMLRNSGLFWIWYNRRTRNFAYGSQAPARTGDRSLDSSWVTFEVQAAEQDAAQVRVELYIAQPKATYKGMFVTLLNDGRIIVDNEVLDWTLDPEVTSSGTPENDFRVR